jgi:hypothetical protein
VSVDGGEPFLRLGKERLEATQALRRPELAAVVVGVKRGCSPWEGDPLDHRPPGLRPLTLRSTVNLTLPVSERLNEILVSTVSELCAHVGRGDRKAAARKAARTRKAKKQKRSASARKGARHRATV